MRIILKYILKGILDKKLRTFLVIISVAVSSALVFASAAISDTLVDMFSQRMQQYFGTSDFIVHTGGNMSGRSYSQENARKYKEQFEYIIGGFLGNAKYKDIDDKAYDITLSAMDLDDYKTISPIYIEQERNLYPFDGKKIIVGNSIAARFGWKLNDRVELKINGSKHKYTIGAIAEASGFLFDDGESITIIVPEDTLSSLYGMRGRDNALYFKMKDPEQKDQIVDQITKIYKGCGFSWFSMTTNIDVPLKLMTVVVCFMSIFIIYSTFRVITLERLPAMGTFRSIGATKKTTSLLLLAESSIYGTLGGIFGCGLGVVILYIMAGTMKNSWTRNVETTITFAPLHMLLAFATAVILCFVSSLIPIIKVSGISLKDIILNAISRQYKSKPWKALCGIGILILSQILPQIVPEGMALPVGMGGLIMIAVGIVLLVPYITSFAVKILEIAYTFIFGNVGVLAAKNLRQNNSIHNSISLLSIGIATLLLVSNSALCLNNELINIYSCYDFDISFYYHGTNKSMEQRISSTDGVDSVLGQHTIWNTYAKGYNNNIGQIHGVGSGRYFDFWEIDMDLKPDEMFRELDSGRNIMMTNNLRHLLGIEKGDVITLEMRKGDRSYSVIGFYDTSLNMGSHAIISERFLRLDGDLYNYSTINIKTIADSTVVADSIKNKFKRESPDVETVEELLQRSIDDNSQLTDTLYGFAALTLLIGIVGVFNNLLISFIERQHSLAVLKSVGMSRKQTLLMIFVEALTGGLVGGIAGAVTGSLQLLLVPGIMQATGQYFPVGNDFRAIVIFVAAGMIITLVASISPGLKSSKLDIVSSLKYE